MGYRVGTATSNGPREFRDRVHDRRQHQLEEYDFHADDQLLIDTTGNQIKSSFDQSDRTKTFFTTSSAPFSLAPGEQIKVDLAFDVPPGQRAKGMVLHDSSLSHGVGVDLPPY